MTKTGAHASMAICAGLALTTLTAQPVSAQAQDPILEYYLRNEGRMYPELLGSIASTLEEDARRRSGLSSKPTSEWNLEDFARYNSAVGYNIDEYVDTRLGGFTFLNSSSEGEHD